MTSIFDEIRQQSDSVPTEGCVWLTMLIKYNFKTGNAEVVRSFSKPAKQSSIKKTKKKKQKQQGNVVNLPKTNKTKNKEIELF